MTKIKIALDAGHGIDTYPKRGKGVPGMAEFEFNSAVAGYAKKMLEDSGYEVILTQPLQGNSVSLWNRVALARDNQADLLISIHADFSSNPTVRGYWAFYWHESKAGKQFATTWEAEAKKRFPHPSRGTRAGKQGLWTNFHMTREPHKLGIPAVLIEHGFMSNADDLALLKSDEFRELAAGTITAAVKKMLPISKVDWRIEMGKDALKKLHNKGLISKPEQVSDDLYKALPGWFQLVLYSRILDLIEPP